MRREPSAYAANLGHMATMNRAYRHQRHVYDLTRKYYLFGRDTMLDRLDIPEGGRVLEIGCGTGRNLVATARRIPHALFYGFDISGEMLEQARANLHRSRAAPRIFLAQGDAENFDARRHFRVEGFDRAFMSYTVSMIPGWQQAVRHALTQLKPGGSLHLVDFGPMTGWPGIARIAIRRWLAAFHVDPRDTLPAMLDKVAGDAGLHANLESIGAGYAVIASIGPAKQPLAHAKQRGGIDRFARAMQP